MSGKNTIFEDKKIKKVISTKTKNYNYDRWHWCWQNTGLKKEPYGTIIHDNFFGVLLVLFSFL